MDRFERNLDVHQRADYKEARVRIEFIDPFFEALGWDVRNVQGRGELDKDVIHEDAIKVGGKTRAPDYSFRIGRERRFFLEAKKPAISLEGDVGPPYQLRRYSWSVKLPLGVLTDFEEFAVYGCRQRPKPTDKPTVSRPMPSFQVVPPVARRGDFRRLLLRLCFSLGAWWRRAPPAMLWASASRAAGSRSSAILATPRSTASPMLKRPQNLSRQTRTGGRLWRLRSR